MDFALAVEMDPEQLGVEWSEVGLVVFFSFSPGGLYVFFIIPSFKFRYFLGVI